MTSTAASAASINLRHEYMPDRDGDKHRDRITVGHRFDNGIGFSVALLRNSMELNQEPTI
ncbi:oligogalacturonate-specific porin KdgM family protein [Vibrio celticus]|uniref:oligogalacturonate-specific porin KdgM family protein n=1 Tax=Vibrio celticus TaxID=446372 RepID=UPI00080F74AA|nr:oligogalacturonate-specific porin KdgM family protein [Vibrio celticus]